MEDLDMNEKERSQKMFEILVEEHAPMLVSYLSAVTGSRNDADDIAQETFLRAFRKFAKFEGGGSGFAAWLRTIGRNLAIDRYRRSEKIVVSDPQIFEGIEDVFGAADRCGTADSWTERVSLLKQCLESLSDRLLSVCRLHYFKGLKARTISERLNVTLQTVLKRLERARGAVRECIERKLGLLDQVEVEINV